MGSKISKETYEKWKDELDFLENATWEQIKDHILPMFERCDEHIKSYVMDLPHSVVSDLIITYHAVYEFPKKGRVHCTITQELLDEFQIGVEDLHRVALSNMEHQGVASFHDVIAMIKKSHPNAEAYKELLPYVDERYDDAESITDQFAMSPFYMITNLGMVGGANVILNDEFMDMMCEYQGESFILVSLSGYEWLLVRKMPGMNIEVLRKVVDLLNATKTWPAIPITTHIYEYSGKNHDMQVIRNQAQMV